MSDTKTKHYIINYSDITNIPFIDIDSDKLQVINNRLTTIYADTNLRQGKNINISLDGFINVTNTFINDNDINKIYYNGNVGIGTTNPSSLLNIYDSINSSNLLNISENGLLLDTNINVVKNNIELGSSTSKINKINCNFLNNIDTSFLTENNLKNEIFYTRTDINGITSGITTTINTKSTDNRAYTTEIFTNSSNYINEEIVQVTSELETYSDTQILTALNNSSNYSEELFTNSSNYNTELFTNSSNYGEELFINSSNYIDNEITRVSGDVISNAFTTNIRTELPSLKITGTYSHTQLLEQLAEETTGFDGWQLVRFLPDGLVSAFSSTDNLVGTDIYGNPSDFTSEWSIEFQSGGYDEYLFVGGNFVDWLILNKTQFIPLDGSYNEVINAIKSSVNLNPHTVKAGTGSTGDRPLIALTEWGRGKHLYQESSGGTLQYGAGTYAERPYYIFVRNSADKNSSVNIIGNIANASGIILKSDVNSNIDTKSFIILKSANSNVNDGTKIYNYKDDNLLISTNNNDIYSPTVILNNRKMILGYDTTEYFASPNTEIYNRTNTLEIKGDININGNLKKNNETINLNIWSTQTDSVNYIGDIIFKDINPLTNTAYANGSLVTVAGDLSSNKQGLIIEKSDRTQRIGITDCSIKQLGSSTNAKLLITSKGNLPVSIGNETNNTLQIYENRALVDNKFGINTGESTLIVPMQVGPGTNTSNVISRSSVAILSGESSGATELCALSLINSKTVGAVNTACSIGFNLSREWGPSVKINAICTNATTQASDLIFSTHNGTSLTEKIRILANGNIGIGISAPYEKLYINGNMFTYGIQYISGGDLYARDNNTLQAGALNIGSTDKNYGGGNVWNSNTAGLLLECLNNTEIAVHDNGNRISSLMYFEGDSNHRLTIGRDMGYGEISKIILNGNVGIGTLSPEKKLDIRSPNAEIQIYGNSTGDTAGIRISANNNNTNAPLLYLYASGTDQACQIVSQYNYPIKFYVNNYEKLIIAKSGNVGIGTTTPTQKLDIYGGNLVIRTAQDENGDASIYFGTPHTSVPTLNKCAIIAEGQGDLSRSKLNFCLSEGGNTYADAVTLSHSRMCIDHTGNVGIGLGSVTPKQKLSIDGKIAFQGGEFSDGSCGMSYYHGAQSTERPFILFDSSGSTVIRSVDNNTTDGIKLQTYDGTDRITIINNGNVGIGTTNPQSLLHLAGAGDVILRLQADTNNSGEGDNPMIEFRQDGNLLTGVIGTGNLPNGVGSNDTAMYLQHCGGNGIIFLSGPSQDNQATSVERMRITNTGNVGIGTTSPNYKLDVNGTFNCTSLTVGGDDINSLINIGTNIFEGTDTKVSIGTTEKYDNAILSIDVGDEGTMLSSPDKSQFLWRIKHDEKWGMYWSTETSGNNYYIHNDANPNQIVFVGNNVSKAAIDLDNGAFWSKDWYYLKGNGGIYWQDHGGGWHMDESTTIKVYGTKHVQCTNNLYVDEKIGIGTNSPKGKLHIYESSGTVHSSTNGTIILEHGNNGGASSIIFKSKVNSGSDYGYIQYQDSSSVNASGEEAKLIIGTQNDSSDDIILLPSGNVGVGTTVPTEILDVNGNIKLTGVIMKGESNYIQEYFSNNSLSITGTNNALNSNNIVVGVHIAKYGTDFGYIDIRSSDDAGGWIDFSKTENSDYKTRIRGYNNPAKLVFYVDDSTEKLVINSIETNINNKLICNNTIETGQIVIKRVKPLLDIDGLNNSNPSINMRYNSLTTTGFRLEVDASFDTFSFIKNTGGGDETVYTISSPGDITFYEDVTVNKILTVTGNTSIGGNITVTGTSNLSNTLTVGTLGTDTEILEVKGKARIRNELLCDNDIVAYYSDERLKKKLNSLSNVLENLEKIDVFKYENSDIANKYFENKLQIGLSAQEINKYYPELVALAPFDSIYDEIQNKFVSKSGENYLTLKYDRLVVVSLQGIKELNNKNKNLENKIENLENKNLKLENELEKIKKYLNI